jgi:glycine betaine/choline ABC-type transport system substrate-binding protein
MVVRPDTAEKYKLETLSDLTKAAKELKLGADPEFRYRKDGLPGLGIVNRGQTTINQSSPRKTWSVPV